MLQSFLHVAGQEAHSLYQMRVLLCGPPIESLLEGADY
jgi:hypothetical protein